jgi:hypothetical protein
MFRIKMGEKIQSFLAGLATDKFSTELPLFLIDVDDGNSQVFGFDVTPSWQRVLCLFGCRLIGAGICILLSIPVFVFFFM